MIKIFVFSALGLLVASFLGIWLITQIRYRIGSRHVKVLLFGLPLRRLPLESIDSVSKRRTDGFAEHWWSTLRPKHRVLVLRRQRGLFRNFVITPKNRYIFKTDLERAIQRVTGRVLSSASDLQDSESGGDADSAPARPVTPRDLQTQGKATT